VVHRYSSIFVTITYQVMRLVRYCGNSPHQIISQKSVNAPAAMRKKAKQYQVADSTDSDGVMCSGRKPGLKPWIKTRSNTAQPIIVNGHFAIQ
jgi:hypothetical protein